MKKTIFLVSLVALSACGVPLNEYQPKLSQSPKDPRKYEDDLSACRHRVSHPPINLIYGFGLIGGAAANAYNNDPVDDDWTAPAKRVDICMAQKGYKVSQ